MGTSSKPKPRILPDQAILRELLDYDAETGVLTWKARAERWFPPGVHSSYTQCSRWNTKWAGKPALTNMRPNGYLKGALFDETVKAHRVIWKWMTGEEPEFIDHINGKRADNSWVNLRAVTKLENCRNACRRSDNTSGVTGVTFRKDTEKWSATITINQKAVSLGCFIDKDDAITARLKAQKQFGFHENHGRAPHG